MADGHFYKKIITTGADKDNTHIGFYAKATGLFFKIFGATEKTIAYLESPSFTTPALGTPSSGTLTNCTSLPAASVNQGTMVSGMVLVAPALGTPASGTLTNCTGFPAASVNVGALANGMTATTQAAGSNDTKVATNAYVDTSDVFTLMFLSGIAFNPADGQTYYIGTGRIFPSTTAANHDINLGIAFKITGAIVIASISTTPSDAATSTLQIRNTTQATSSSCGTFSTNTGSATVNQDTTLTGLNISIASGDSFCVQWDCPTWATQNPLGIVMSIILTCKRTA